MAIPSLARTRVAVLEAALLEARRPPAPVAPLAVSVERYLRDLRATVDTNPDKARRLLARGVERIVLRRQGPLLIADVFGNLAGVLQISETNGEGMVDDVGAGSPARIVPYHRAQVSWLPPANLRRNARG